MNSLRLKYLALLICGSLVVACSRTVVKDSDLSWPSPPQPPRVVYERSIYGSQNLPRSFLSKIKDFLFGRSPDMSMAKPYGITYDGRSRLYVADTAHKGILVFNLNAGGVKFFNSIGSRGNLAEPVNVVLDNHDNIYVADTKLGKIAVFNREFDFVKFIGDEQTLESPVGMAVDNSARILFVVDTKLHMVKVFDLEGNFLYDFGGRGDEKGEFYYPLGIAINGRDTVYVIDSFHFAVQAFDYGGNFLFSFGHAKAGVGRLARPRDIAIDSDNNLYITDALNNNVQVFSSRGEFMMEFGALGYEHGQFRLPAGIFIADNDIYVSDSINKRIQKFRYLADSDARRSSR